MLRWLTHILDIKNLLGMQRIPLPMPIYPPDEFVMRALNDDVLDFTPNFTGTLTVRVGEDEDTYPVGYSGAEISVGPISAGTDVILTGNITSVSLLHGANVQLLSINDTVDFVSLADNITVLDLRNGSNVLMYDLSISNVNVRELYANARTIVLKSLSTNVINGSTVADGIVWVDRNEPDIAQVITAAENKGWTVYEL